MLSMGEVTPIEVEHTCPSDDPSSPWPSSLGRGERLVLPFFHVKFWKEEVLSHLLALLPFPPPSSLGLGEQRDCPWEEEPEQLLVFLRQEDRSQPP